MELELCLCFVFLLLLFVTNIMQERKLSPNHAFQTRTIQKTDKGVSRESTTSQPKNKDSNIFAGINHKNPSGANNWQNFLKLNPPKSGVKKNSNAIGTKVNLTADVLGRKISSAKKSLVTKDKFNSLGSDSKSLQSFHTKNDVSNRPFLRNENMKPVFHTKTGYHGLKHTGTNKPVLTKQIAMDCEMVGVEVGVKNSILARVSLVNAHGDCIYDKFVKPTELVLDYRTGVSGVRPKDLENATEFKIVQEEVANILRGRVLVGHALKNDLSVLFLSHPRYAIRDTSKFKRFKMGRIPALKTLAQKYLGVTIQDGEHSSVQDALAAMQLYKMFKKEWEASFHPKKSQINEKKGPGSELNVPAYTEVL